MAGTPEYPRLRSRSLRPALGVAYYPEYSDDVDLDRDLTLMRRAGISVVRVGESTWSTWEPRDGEFVTAGMQDLLDAAHRHGVSAVLGTPTYAIPPWLAHRYPHIVGRDSLARPLGWGGRQEMDLTAEDYRAHARRITRQVVAAFSDHPAVIGYQIDNEPGAQLLYNEGVVDRFRLWLARRVGTAQEANSAWRLDYWSHRLTSWDELWSPATNRQPQYDLAWRLFQTEIVDEFIAEMAEEARRHARPDQFVTTCVAHDRPGADDWSIARSMDIAASNSYYRMQDAFAHPAPMRPQTWMTDGAWSVALTADRVFAAKQAPFLITETNAGPIHASSIEEPGWDGQWRQAGWLMFLRGARLTGYWHWNTARGGTETYWGGVLPHDGEPGRVYANIAALGAEVERVGDLVAETLPDADTGVLFSTASKFALAHEPVFADETGVDGRSYLRLVESFARAGFTAGRQTRVIHDRSLAAHTLDPEHLPLVIAAGLYVAEDPTLDALLRYAEAGGHLLVGPRTAVAAGWAVVRTDRKPARLAAAAGASYQEFSTLTAPVAIAGAGPLSGARGHGSSWVELLEPAGAEVLARYEHPQFGAFAAITSAVVGRGRITVVGTLLDDELSAALFAWIDRLEGRERPALPSSVTSCSATAEDGSRRVRAWFNWSWDPIDITLPSASSVVVGDPGGRLGPWDVCIASEPVDAAAAPTPDDPADAPAL